MLPALTQQEKWGGNQRFAFLQRRMLAGKAELHFPECSWPCLLPGERLRDPVTGSSLLLNYSPYYLFVVFLHLTVCLVHLIGGLLLLPARPPEPNSLLRLIYDSEAAETHPAAPSPPAQAAGGDGGKQTGARMGTVTMGTAMVQPGSDQNQPLQGMEASQQPPPAPGISPGHRCSWQST